MSTYHFGNRRIRPAGPHQAFVSQRPGDRRCDGDLRGRISHGAGARAGGPDVPLAPGLPVRLHGDFDVQQSNGAVVHLDTDGPFELVGVAHATGTGGSGNDTMDGTVSGGLSGNQTSTFTIRWNSGPIGKYTGVVDDGGFTHGTSL